MNQYPSPPSPALRQAVPRKRRAARKPKKSALFFSWWQWAVLGALCVGALIAFFSWSQANGQMNALLARREEARQAYENEVARHQVKYRDLITYYAAVNRIDPAYVAAVIKRESDYDPQAVSRVQARGLMQIMPDTGEWLAGKISLADYTVERLFEPEISIQMGCWYLGYLSRLFDGDPVLVACAYHAGQGNVRSWLQKYSPDGKTLSIDEIPTDDTRYYAGKVLNAYAIYQQHYYTN